MLKKLLCLVLIGFLLSVFFPIFPAVQAYTAIPDLKSDNTNLYFQTHYRYYPKYAVTSDGNIDLRARSATCSPEKQTPTYKTLPWLGYYNNGTTVKVTEAAANNMYSTGTCSDRYHDGGVASGSNGWMPAEMYGGWANKGTKSTSTVAYTSAGTNIYWKTANVISVANTDLYPSKFNKTAISSDLISGVSSLTSTDSASQLFQDNGYSTWSNIEGEKLLSSGTGYFRKQFTLSDSQIASVKGLTINYQADDFVAIYLNGYKLHWDYNAPSGAEGTYTESAITVSESIVKPLLSSSETNVLAFQVNDKATWVTASTASTTSNSNATGLKYLAHFNQADPDPEPECAVSVEPQTGTSPLALEVTVSSATLTNSWNISVTGPNAQSKNGVTSPAYFNIPLGGSYVVTASHTGGTNCGSGVTVNVQDPTDGSGNETNP